jgi:hypothetical protein
MIRRLPKTSLYLLCSAAVSLVLSGCGMSREPIDSTPAAVPGVPLKGNFFGGQQPVIGLRVQLYAAGNTGYGSAYPYTSGTSLLGTDVVVTTAGGAFSITGHYTCPTAATPVFLVGTGGVPIVGKPANPNLAMMAALGPCGNLSSSTFINVDEVTTVGSIFALAPFMTSKSQVGTSPGNTVGLVNAFATVNELVNIGSGLASGPALPAGATLPVSEINTLADIIEPCVNSAGGTAGDGSSCGTLFSLTPSSTGVSPTDTIAAELNIAQNPAQNVAALNNLASAHSDFQPILGTAVPAAWTIAIRHNGGGTLAQPTGVAADQAGNIWIANLQSSSVTKLAPSGALLSGTAGYATGHSGLGAIAIDQGGNAWVPSNLSGSILKINAADGTYNTFSGGGLGISNTIAVDGQGQIWASGNKSNLSAFTGAGIAVSPTAGYTGSGLTNAQSEAITPF